ncbi:MAG: hypothetical protein MJ175_08950 [Clostridia bacterium]|nr:hypothetical protein [Clostridia bacterium]
MDYQKFVSPEREFYPRPLWFWNTIPTQSNIRAVIDSAEETGYAGFGILPYDACGLTYMEEDYLNAYRCALEGAKERGLKLCLYDEWWFPSGSAGGRLKRFHLKPVQNSSIKPKSRSQKDRSDCQYRKGT